jgi:hypothetical protein
MGRGGGKPYKEFSFKISETVKVNRVLNRVVKISEFFCSTSTHIGYTKFGPPAWNKSEAKYLKKPALRICAKWRKCKQLQP